ncbi:hypothetical protein L53_04780 [Hyphomonas sp. L-53-1-40]|uniref:hypothetical protein n=1 Tax=Hyphomonas sp. L-53-1-40 TaxID=1207058 RepID=UPI0004591525|nr:hypothetical protein [Hyphomonas sp. L-53-1-40]KCZ63813.1 hypothetical protein L53_04780 [Hyphomonas sp. L-53-1-40]
MALPKSKPAIPDESSAQEAAKSKDMAQANMQSASLSEPRYPAAPSPARRLQSLLEAEMRGTRAPSVKRSMATMLVLSLACSVGALSLYSLGWI